MTPIYVGPSWAVRSWDHEASNREKTNLPREWDISVTNLAEQGTSNLILLNKVKQYLKNNPQERSTPIIWLYCEPLPDSYFYSELTMEKILAKEDWWEKRSIVNQCILQDINDLGNPIGMIGSHSDVEDCNFTNITVIHPSWQKFMCEHVGLKDQCKHGWGADVAHCVVALERLSKPSHSVVDAITELFSIWHRLEMHDIFYEHHANLHGNKFFAKHIESDVKQWLSQFK